MSFLTTLFLVSVELSCVDNKQVILLDLKKWIAEIYNKGCWTTILVRVCNWLTDTLFWF